LILNRNGRYCPFFAIPDKMKISFEWKRTGSTGLLKQRGAELSDQPHRRLLSGNDSRPLYFPPRSALSDLVLSEDVGSTLRLIVFAARRRLVQETRPWSRMNQSRAESFRMAAS
jgi:hypothetical protein